LAENDLAHNKQLVAQIGNGIPYLIRFKLSA
jgi:hypothetical protein